MAAVELRGEEEVMTGFNLTLWQKACCPAYWHSGSNSSPFSPAGEKKEKRREAEIRGAKAAWEGKVPAGATRLCSHDLLSDPLRCTFTVPHYMATKSDVDPPRLRRTTRLPSWRLRLFHVSFLKMWPRLTRVRAGQGSLWESH